MSTKSFRRILALILVSVTTAAVLAGCDGFPFGKTREEKVSVAKANTGNLFREIASPLDKLGSKEIHTSEVTDDDMGEEGIVFTSAFAKKGLYYTLYSNMDEGTDACVSIFDADGKKAQNISLPTPKEGAVNCISADDKGRIYMVSCDVGKNEELVYQIRCLGDKQKEVWKKNIKTDENFEPQGMVTTDKYTALLTYSDVRIFDNEKGTEKVVKSPVSDMIAKICTDSSGNLLLVGWKDDDGLAAWKYDEEKQAFAAVKVSGKGFYYSEAVSSGSGKYDFYIAKEDGVYGFKTDGSKPVKVVDLIASGLKYIEFTALSVMSENSVLVLAVDDDMNSISGLLKRMDEKAAEAKTVLTLGCLSAPYNLQEDIIKFNKRSEKYIIKMIEYSPVEEDVGVLNEVIISGNVPDILYVNDSIPVESYANKGVFEDIGPWFERDAEISGNQYLDNILDAFRIDGRMYFVTPSFSLMGLAGKKKDFGKGRGVSVKQLDKMIKEYDMKPETALGLVTRGSVLSWITDYSNDQYVDMEKGTCSFDSDSFIDLLKFAKKFPKKITYSLVTEDSDLWVRSGKQLMAEMYLSSFNSYMDLRYGTFGQEIVMTGYPGDGNGGPVIYSSLILAMCRDSDQKEACWDFLREYYLDDYQNKINNDFPVSRAALKKMADKAMEPQYSTYTDENGKTVTEKIEDYFYLGDSKVLIPLPEEKDIDVVVGYLEDADQRSSVDGHISSIIEDEVGAFFAGQKSAEQTADVIQRRVSIYIKEMQ